MEIILIELDLIVVVSSYLPTYLPTCLPTYLPTYLGSYWINKNMMTQVQAKLRLLHNWERYY